MIKYLNQILILNGISGTNYEFQLYSFNTFTLLGFCKLFKENDCGVYIFTKEHYAYKEEEYQHDLIYCGESIDLSTRFYDHHREKDILEVKATHFGVLFCYKNQTKSFEKDILANNDFMLNVMNN